MITTSVFPGLVVYVTLRFRGNGMQAGIPMIIDTGFSEFLSLPQSWIDALGFPFLQTDNVTLADGTRIPVNIHEAVVEWDGQERVIPVHCLEGDALIGMALMADYLLHLPVRVNSSVTLTALP
jgi:clan AA aspartic protease